MPSIHGPNYDYLTELRSRGWATFAPKYSIGHFDQFLNQAIYKDPVAGSYLTQKKHKERRRQTLTKAYDEGLVPQHIIRQGASKAASWAKKNLQMDVMTDEEIIERIREDLSIVEKTSAEMQNRAGLMDTVKQLGGSLIPEILNPILIPAWFVGYGPAAAGMRTLAGVGRVIAIEAGVESAYQAAKYQWVDEISEASIKDSIYSVAAVTGAVGGLGVGAYTLSKAIRRFLSKLPSKDMDLAKSYAAHKADQMADEMADADKGVSAIDQAKKLQAEDKYQNTVHLKEQELRNDTQLPDIDDETLDRGFEKIIEEKPDLEIAERIVVEAGEERVVTTKAKDIVKRLAAKVESLNKLKECLIG